MLSISTVQVARSTVLVTNQEEFIQGGLWGFRGILTTN